MIIHAVAQKRKIPNTLYVVVALKPANTITGWLSSLQTVALKPANTQLAVALFPALSIARNSTVALLLTIAPLV